MTPSIPIPIAAVTQKRLFVIPFERACRVMPKLFSSALGGELRERGEGDFVVSCAGEDVYVHLEREGAETACLVRIDTPFDASSLALEVDRIKRAASFKGAAFVMLIAFAVVVMALLIAWRAPLWSAPALLLLMPFFFAIPNNVIARVIRRRGEVTMEKKAARIRAALAERKRFTTRALAAIEAHVAAQRETPGYRIAPYEVEEDPEPIRVDRRAMR